MSNLQLTLDSQNQDIDFTPWFEKKFSNPKATINLATLFSGVGAIEYSLKRLNLKTNLVFAGDIDKFCKESYFENYKIDEKNWHDDVTKFSAKKYKYKVDLLVGGSPCQSFSMVGKRLGLEDLGYDIHHQVLNSRDYGIPQNRERIFVVGFRKKTQFIFPEPIELKTTMQDFLEDNINSKFYLGDKGVKFVTNEKNIKKRFTQINGEVALCQKRNQQSNWHGDFIFEGVEEFQDYGEFIFDVNKVEDKYYLSDKVSDYVLNSGTKNFYAKPETDLPVARALLSTMHKMHRAGVDNYVTYKKGRIRKLTPRECFRLMGFRDDFKITVSNNQAYRQAGNSIVVDVLIALLKQMDISKYGR
jgi:DNA (cytosine-5)-methyltransferase 1